MRLEAHASVTQGKTVVVRIPRANPLMEFAGEEDLNRGRRKFEGHANAGDGQASGDCPRPANDVGDVSCCQRANEGNASFVSFCRTRGELRRPTKQQGRH
jgi:hypothetical protein